MSVLEKQPNKSYHTCNVIVGYTSQALFSNMSHCVYEYSAIAKEMCIYIYEDSLQLDSYLIKLHLVDGYKRKEWSLEGWKYSGLWNTIPGSTRRGWVLKAEKFELEPEVTVYSLGQEFSVCRYSYSYFPHLNPDFAQMLPFQWDLLNFKLWGIWVA